MEKIKEIVCSIIGNSTFLCVVSASLGAFVTHMLYSSKLKKERISKSLTAVGEQIANSLKTARDYELSSTVIEVFDADESFDDEGKIKNYFDRQAIYPQFMSDAHSFEEFATTASRLRSEQSAYLDYLTAAYLFYIERYCMNLANFIRANELKNDFPLVGAVVIVDVQRWQRKIDKNIVKNINKASYKVFSQQGLRWGLAKWWVQQSLWKKTVLHNLQKGSNNKTLTMVRRLLGIE